jgi:hypothetical protein
MKINEVISNVNIYGFDNAIKGGKYPMSTDIDKLTSEVTKVTKLLATCEVGEGHDNFLNGILVQFDLTFTNKAWVEAERYHFLDFISSQSTMHRITKFDLDSAYISYVDERIIDIIKEKVKVYNNLLAINKTDPTLKEKYLEILYSNPAGFKLTAKMTTNYRQLKTMYKQRRNHRLPEWQAFCDWCETLEYSEFITGKK